MCVGSNEWDPTFVLPPAATLMFFSYFELKIFKVYQIDK